MLEQFLEISKCPKCKSPLTQNSGSFGCSLCEHIYPIEKGIPRFVVDEGYSESFGFQWNIYSKTQLDKFNGSTVSHDRLFSQSKWEKAELANKYILECGSGAGRFTQVLCDTHAKVFSLDYSSAVIANLANNKNYSNLFLIQASIYDLPFKDESFDYLVCLGVIQHTPDVKQSVFKMISKLKKGGKFCIDVYASPITYFHPRHFVRFITKKMDKEKLFFGLEKLVKVLFPISSFLHKIPVIGQVLARLIPIANWKSNIRLLRDEQYLEWSLLDTFDWYSPAFESPQTKRTLTKWMEELKVTNYEIKRVRGLYVLSGTK
jgi:SAM-dependent methyltransferase